MSDTAIKSDEPLTIGRLPIGSIGHESNGWWGMLLLIVTESFLFGYLLFSYYYFASHAEPGSFPAEQPSFRLSGPNTVILIVSSIAVWWGEHSGKRGSRGGLLAGLSVGFVLGAIFVAIQVIEWMEKPFTIASHAYGSSFFTTTGFHMAHVVGGLVVLLALIVWSALGYFDRERMAPISIGSIYWHFVDVVWLAVFFTFYVTPYLR